MVLVPGVAVHEIRCGFNPEHLRSNRCAPIPAGDNQSRISYIPEPGDCKESFETLASPLYLSLMSIFLALMSAPPHILIDNSRHQLWSKQRSRSDRDNVVILGMPLV